LASEAMRKVTEFFSKNHYTSKTNKDGWIDIYTPEKLWGQVAIERNFICAVFYIDSPDWSEKKIKQTIENIRKSGN
jgi:hypothetical protein